MSWRDSDQTDLQTDPTLTQLCPNLCQKGPNGPRRCGCAIQIWWISPTMTSARELNRAQMTRAFQDGLQAPLHTKRSMGNKCMHSWVTCVTCIHAIRINTLHYIIYIALHYIAIHCKNYVNVTLQFIHGIDTYADPISEGEARDGICASCPNDSAARCLENMLAVPMMSSSSPWST